MQVRTQSAGGDVYNDHDRPPRRFASRRLCAHVDCETRLSIYNDSEYCSLHHIEVKPRIRGRKVR